MRWRKLGRVFAPGGQFSWMQSHAQAPVAHHLHDDVFRIFFACRDAHQRSHVAFVDIDIRKPGSVLRVANEPVLTPGPLGFSDDFGIYAASIVPCREKLWMYTIGWNPGIRRPLFYSTIGLATSIDGGETFQKYSNVPIMARSSFDPCLVTAPFVLLEGSRWRMWYVSGYKWEEAAGELQSHYHIKYAESENGVDWKRDGLVMIENEPGERNIARPSILKDDAGYRMWYSRSTAGGYRIGYATSADGLQWIRRDSETYIDVSADGWDSESLAYPHVFNHRDELYMVYNGNRFGADGFGLAVLS